MARANPPLMASFALRMFCWQANVLSWPVTAGADAVWLRARGHGFAIVIVTEVDPLKALEAVMDGFEVMSMKDAAKIGDFFCTVTGDINVIDKSHFEVMKDGAIVANSGHFNVEINIPALEKMSKDKPNLVRPFVEQYITKDGRKINILGEGRLDQPRICRRASGFRDGYVFCQSGISRGVYGQECG